ncbi:MAG: GNAT family N-acetyltransferase [Defluviitaleaceae bacterium]|nr:GNAT family N-acetyltransferase [Defluviitaleaceae bacterium]
MMVAPVTALNVQEWATLCDALWPDEDSTIRSWIEDWQIGDFPHEFLYYHNNEAIAFISLDIRSEYVEGTKGFPVGYVEGIYVKPDFRKHGIARKLIEFAKSWTLSQNCEELASDCELDNEESLLFHKKVGFAEANRIICFAMDLSPT